MKRNNITSFMFVLVSLFVSPALAQQLTLHCYNPPMNGLKFTRVGASEASSQLIQFNIGIPAVAGTIFVNHPPTGGSNDGVCIAQISGPYAITDGRANFVPGGSSVSSPAPLKGDDMNRYVTVTPTITGTQSIEFDVSTDANTAQYNGVVTLTFIVDYKDN